MLTMDDNFGIMVSQIARLMRRNFDDRARKLGVTRPQWLVLGLLARHSGINQGGLADILEVEPITLGRMIDRLQEADLVERLPDPADRRAWRLQNTPKGMAQLAALQPLGEATFDLALDGIDADERVVLMAMLDRICTNLTRKSGPYRAEMSQEMVNG